MILRRAALGCLSCLLLCPSIRPLGQEPEDLLRRSISLLNASRPAEAEQTLRSMIAKHPSFLKAHIMLGYLLLQRSDLAGAEEAFNRALSTHPQNAAARLGFAVVLAQRGTPQQSVRELDKIVSDPELGINARAQRVRSLFLAKRDNEALQEARRLTAKYPSVAEFHGVLGYLYLTQGKNDEALKSYLTAAELDPQSLPYHFSIIGLYRSRQEWQKALSWTDRSLELDGNHPLLYEEKAKVLDRLGEKDQAEAARDEGRKKYESELLFTKAAQAAVAGKEEEAERLLRSCVELNPGLSKAWAQLGELLRRQGRFENAHQTFLMALETDPNNATASLGIAACLKSLGKNTEAVRELEKALERGQSTPDLLVSMANAYLNHGRALEAARLMMQAVTELPDDPDLLAYLGYLRETGGQNQEAAKAYADALRLQPNHPGAALGKARAKLAGGDCAGAAAEFQAAVKADPGNAEGWHGLIQAHRRTRDMPSAEAACRDCLGRMPTDVECREQLASLLLEAQDYRASAEQFAALIRGGTESKNILDSLAFSLVNTGDHGQAIDWFERSLNRYGVDGWILSNLGYLHRCRGDLPAAVASYRRARDLAPNDAVKQHDLGIALYLSRKYEAAVEPLQAALRLKPNWGQAHLNLAMTYWSLQQYGLALWHAQAAQDQGVEEARHVAQALSSNLSLAMPRVVSALRPKKGGKN
jgi:tetratricopeptide (TPR) repeat protein